MTTLTEAPKSPGKGEAPSKGMLAFIKDLASYYMDFLETDFHRRKTPKRSVRFRNADNLLVGINLGRYPNFTSQAWKLILSGFEKSEINHISKGSYRTTIPRELLELIKLEIEKIFCNQIVQIRKAIAKEIDGAASTNGGDIETALNLSLEAAGEKIRAELVLPFVCRVQTSLQQADLSDENTIFLMEEELRELILEPACSKISEILRRLIAELSIDSDAELQSVFKEGAIRSQIADFFSNLSVGELFGELYEIERNRSSRRTISYENI